VDIQVQILNISTSAVWAGGQIDLRSLTFCLRNKSKPERQIQI